MKKKGSFTIEAAIFMPFLFFVILTLLQISFFLYNREAVTVMVSQATLHGVQMEQEGKNNIQKKMERFLKEEAEKRLLFVDKVDWEVKVTLTKVKVTVVILQKTWWRSLECEVKNEMIRLNPASIIWEAERWHE